MQARLSFSVLLLSALLLMASPAFSAGGSAPSGEGVSPRCEAAIDRAAGSYSQCLLKASAKFAKKGNEDWLFAQQAKCEDKWSAQVAQAKDRFGKDQCTPYTSQIANRTATCAEEISTEAEGEAAASRLYVQDATGGTLTETTLVLSGVDESTPWFADRPYREAGQIATAEFVALFADEGANSFAENPPNADFTCESGGEVVNQAVTLTDPVLDEAAGTLTYTATRVPTAGDDDSFAGITCDGDAHLFIDDVMSLVDFMLCSQSIASTCEAAGGTWNPMTRTCAPYTGRYNCFIGGFCSELAAIGYFTAPDNPYDGHTQDTDPALHANCNESSGSSFWHLGRESLFEALSEGIKQAGWNRSTMCFFGY